MLARETAVPPAGSTVNLLTYTYDNNGNRLTAANYSGAYTITYVARDRVVTIQEPFGVSLTYTYDGGIATIESPGIMAFAGRIGECKVARSLARSPSSELIPKLNELFNLF
jgi:hypothetical protein